MNENYELKLASALLHKPSEIQNLDINIDWFLMDSVKIVLTALQSKNGEEFLMNDILKTIKQINPLTNYTIDELIDMRDLELFSNYAQFYCDQVHKDFLHRELKKLAKEYALTEDDRFLEQITAYKEELSSLKKSKKDGRINGKEEFAKHLNSSDDELGFIKTFPSLDTTLAGGFAPGELVIVGARPSVGKTAFAINLILKGLQNTKDLATDMFALEMTQKQMMFRFVSNIAKVNNMQIRNPRGLDDRRKEKALKAYEDISALNLRIYDQEYANLNDIVNAIRKRAVKGKYLAVIDYAGLISVQDSRKDERRTMNEVTRRLKLLTNELEITIILLAQLGRETDKNNKPPVLSDLKESGSLEQDANIVMFLYLPDLENRQSVKVKIAKSRDGIIGELPFKFVGQFMDFYPEV